MSDISQTIRIDDEFSAPLKNLAKTSFDASSSVSNLTQAIAAQAEEFEWDQKKIEMTGRFIYELNKQSKDLRKEVGKYITEVGLPRLKMLGQQIKSEASVISNGLRNISVTKMMTSVQKSFHNQMLLSEIRVRKLSNSMSAFYKLGDAASKASAPFKEVASLLGNGLAEYAGKMEHAAYKIGYGLGMVKLNAKDATSAIKEFATTKSSSLFSLVTDKLPTGARSALTQAGSMGRGALRSASAYKDYASTALPHLKNYIKTLRPMQGFSEEAMAQRALHRQSADFLNYIKGLAKEQFDSDLPKLQKGLEQIATKMKDFTGKLKPVVGKIKEQIGPISKSLAGVASDMGQHLAFHSTVAGMYLKNSKQYWGSFFIGKGETRMMAAEARLAASEAMYDAKELERQMMGVYKDMIKVNIETLKVKSATLLQDAKSALSKGKNFLTETSVFKSIANSGFGRVAKSAITSAKMYGGFASAALPQAKNYLSTFIPKSGLSEEAALERRLLRSRSFDMLNDIGGEAKELFNYDASQLQKGLSGAATKAKEFSSTVLNSAKTYAGEIKANAEFTKASITTSAKHFAGEFRTSMEFAKSSFGVTANHVMNETTKTIAGIGSKIKGSSLKLLAKAASLGKKIGNVLVGAIGSTVAWMGVDFIGGAMDKLGKMMLHKLENTLLSVRESIAKSLEDIDLSDKLNARWGEPMGKRAKKEMFDLAQELGESQRMVTGLMSKAAYEGIGTDSFKRTMRLADKVAALSPGKTTEEVASSMLDNLKSGHDAGSMSRLFGGGQVMERQLKRSGYERALRRGDVSKALDIAEKIAEQAGLTDKKYKDATGGLAQDFQRVNNVIENIKERLGEIYNKQLGNIVKRVREFLDSDKFKEFMKFAEAGARRLGEFVTGFVNTLLNNLHIILGLVGGAFVIKTLSLIRLLTMIPSLLTGVRMGTTFVGKAVNWLGRVTKINALAAFSWSKLVQGGIKGIGKSLLALVTKNPVGIAITAVAGLTYAILRLTGKVGSLAGLFYGTFKLITTAAHNLSLELSKLLVDIFGAQESKELEEKLIEAGNKRARIMKEQSGTGIEKHYLKQDLNLAKAGRKKLSKKEIKEKEERLAEIAKGEAEFNQKFKEANDEYESIKKQKEELEARMKGEYEKQKKGYDDVWNAFKMNTDDVLQSIKKDVGGILGVETDIKEQMKDKWWAKGLDKLTKITDNTNNIREIMNREEDLRWLKAFSDRQIMHAYSSETSYNRNVNITASGGGAVETFRRYAGSPNRPSGFGG